MQTCPAIKITAQPRAGDDHAAAIVATSRCPGPPGATIASGGACHRENASACAKVDPPAKLFSRASCSYVVLRDEFPSRDARHSGADRRQPSTLNTFFLITP